MDPCFDTTCYALDPDMVSRCGLDSDHVGVHENWYGSWFGGKWFTHTPESRELKS